MTISVAVPLDALKNPKVAQALSDLMLSLGGLQGVVATGDGRRAAARSTAETPAAAPARRGGRRRATPAPTPTEGSEAERYKAFVDGLPKPSRTFLELIRQRGELTLTDAVRELNITVPKAIGGITGSLSRWARERNVSLPFEAGKNSSGERVWRWLRSSEGSNEPARPRSRAREQAPRAGTRRRRTSSAKAASDDGAPSTPQNLANPPPPVGEALFTDPRYSQWLNGMSELAREFLVTLSERGQLTMSEALRRFGLTMPNALSEVVRTLRERAQAQRSPLPYEETRSRAGERMWKWTVAPTAPHSARARGGVLIRKPKKVAASSAP